MQLDEGDYVVELASILGNGIVETNSLLNDVMSSEMVEKLRLELLKEPESSIHSATFQRISGDIIERQRHKTNEEKDNDISSKPITPRNWEKVLQRFSSFDIVKERRLIQKRLHQEATELRGLQDTPEINPKSKEITKDYPRLVERQVEYEKTKAEQMEAFRRAQDEHEISTIADPNIESPCICNSQVHNEACMRFKLACRRKNKSCGIRKKQKAMRRTIHDMLAYGEEKEFRNRTKLKISKEDETRNLTFSPKINSKSHQIFQNMLKDGRDSTSIKKKAAAHEEEIRLKKMFQPKITSKSREICAKKGSQNVFSRLKHEGELQQSRRLKKETSQMDQYIKNIPGVGRHDPRHAALEKQRAIPFTTVRYDQATCGFLLENFQIVL